MTNATWPTSPRLLRSHGIAACTASSAGEALNMLAGDATINAVFCDIMRAGMTGLQLADAIHLRYPNVRVVLISGYTSPALLAEHNWPYPYLPKPYRIEAVIRLLRG